MNETDIRKYAELMKELELTGLEITEDNKVVRLERSAPAIAKEVVSAGPVTDPAPQTEEGIQDYVSVTSPAVGVFYASPTENADPYVAAGDTVKAGQILCIIESMKLMNEITAEEGGVISEVCVEDGQVVEYGTELFRIKR